MKIAIYPGSFDPITNGHLDIIERSSKIFDKVIVSVLHNSAKKPIFSIDEKISMIRKATKNIPNTEVDFFDGLLVDYAKKKSASTIIKGLRAAILYEIAFIESALDDPEHISLEGFTNELKTSIEECKSLCAKLQNGEIKLNDTQIADCNTFANQINYCCKQIKNSKGNCNNYLQTLRNLKNYFGSNSDTLSTNYLNLLGCLETRLSNYKQALECVNNCNNLLKSCYTPTENVTENNNIDTLKNIEDRHNRNEHKDNVQIPCCSPVSRWSVIF